jgi:hypothetical protein
MAKAKKGPSHKGLPAKSGGFAKYTGNLKGGSDSIPSGKRSSPKGGKVTSNANSKTRHRPTKM